MSGSDRCDLEFEFAAHAKRLGKVTRTSPLGDVVLAVRLSTILAAGLFVLAGCAQVPETSYQMVTAEAPAPNETPRAPSGDLKRLAMPSHADATEPDAQNAQNLVFLLGLAPSKDPPSKAAATLNDTSMDAETDVYSRAVSAGCLGLLNYLKAYPKGRYVTDARTRMFADSDCATTALFAEFENYWPEEHEDAKAVHPISKATKRSFQIPTTYSAKPSTVTWKRAEQYLQRAAGKKIAVKFYTGIIDDTRTTPDDYPGAADTVLIAAVAVMAARYIDTKSVSRLTTIELQLGSPWARADRGYLSLSFEPTSWHGRPLLPRVEEVVEALVGPQKFAPTGGAGVIVQ